MKRTPVFVALLLLALAGTAVAQSATVMTDKSDYAPGTIVTITGSGWQAGETITLQLVESPLIDTPPTMTAVADANGNIFNNQFSPDLYDVGITFTLTATGNSSGLQAQTKFTDASDSTISGSVKNGATAVQGVTITAYTDSTLTTLEGVNSGTNPVTSDSSGNWTLHLSKDTNTVYVVATSSSYNFTGLTVVTGGGATLDSNSDFHFSNASSGVTISGNNFSVTPKTSSVRKGRVIVASLSPNDRYTLMAMR
jgi:hypothetical protein